MKAKSNGRIHRRAVLSMLVFAGLRIGELIAPDSAEVDLQARRLRVRQSKTDAGIRYVDLLPVLHAELTALARSVEQANESLAEAKLAALPQGMTPHALRRTFASVLIALGKDSVYVKGQMGHTDPTVTLGLYAKVMQVSDEDRERLCHLEAGGDRKVVHDGGSDAMREVRPVDH